MKRLLITVSLTLLAQTGWSQASAPDAPTASSAKGFAPAAEVSSNLKRLYPQTVFKSVKDTPVPGVYEVVMGRNVAYVDQSARYFLFGRLIDMPVQKDLTENTLKEAQRIDVAALPLADAIKTVRGKGERSLYVISDPDCPYCKRLEDTLRQVQNVTIYTFLYPIASLHPDAERKSAVIWCAQDRAKAWDDFMRKSTLPAGSGDAPPTCDNPVQRNIALAKRLGATGTPTLINSNGRVEAGALNLADLEGFLAGQEKVVSK